MMKEVLYPSPIPALSRGERGQLWLCDFPAKDLFAVQSVLHRYLEKLPSAAESFQSSQSERKFLRDSNRYSMQSTPLQVMPPDNQGLEKERLSLAVGHQGMKYIRKDDLGQKGVQCCGQC